MAKRLPLLAFVSPKLVQNSSLPVIAVHKREKNKFIFPATSEIFEHLFYFQPLIVLRTSSFMGILMSCKALVVPCLPGKVNRLAWFVVPPAQGFDNIPVSRNIESVPAGLRKHLKTCDLAQSFYPFSGSLLMNGLLEWILCKKPQNHVVASHLFQQLFIADTQSTRLVFNFFQKGWIILFQEIRSFPQIGIELPSCSCFIVRPGIKAIRVSVRHSR